MPEITTPTATEASVTPEPIESTADIINSSIADLPDDGGDELISASDDEPAPSASTGDPATPPTAEEVDELAQALGIIGEGKSKWTQRVLYSKVNKVWRELRERHEATLREHQAELRTAQAVERLIQEQPEQFIQRLVAANPAYERYFRTAQPATAAHSGGSPDMPAPDVILPDGSRTYSTEGLQRLLQWNTQQAEQRISQRLQPIERERQQREMIESAIPRVRQQIAEAETWPLFKESKQEILAVLQSDPQADLRGAYQRVVIPKLAANRDRVRKDVLREINERSYSTSVTRTAGGRPDEQAPRSSRDVIEEAIAGME